MDIDKLIKEATLNKNGSAKEAFRAIKTELLKNQTSKNPKPEGKIIYTYNGADVIQDISELEYRDINQNKPESLEEYRDLIQFGKNAEEIKEEPKTLINASVLGLIFEKINGYKDGAVFTPEHITMYMCHDAIRKTILHKFNEATVYFALRSPPARRFRSTVTGKEVHRHGVEVHFA